MGLRSVAWVGVFVCALSMSVSADEGALIFRFGQEGKAVPFVREKGDDGLLISAGCSGKSCEARRAAGQASLKKVPEVELSGGTHPGAAVCRHVSGKVHPGVDVRGNENSFCLFKDGSAVSNGTLLRRARENDRTGG